MRFARRTSLEQKDLEGYRSPMERTRSVRSRGCGRLFSESSGDSGHLQPRKAVTQREERQLEPIGDSALVKDAVQVVLDRHFTEPEPLRHFAIAQPFRQRGDDFPFTWRQVEFTGLLIAGVERFSQRLLLIGQLL